MPTQGGMTAGAVPGFLHGAWGFCGVLDGSVPGCRSGPIRVARLAGRGLAPAAHGAWGLPAGTAGLGGAGRLEGARGWAWLTVHGVLWDEDAGRGLRLGALTGGGDRLSHVAWAFPAGTAGLGGAGRLERARRWAWLTVHGLLACGFGFGPIGRSRGAAVARVAHGVWGLGARCRVWAAGPAGGGLRDGSWSVHGRVRGPRQSWRGLGACGGRFGRGASPGALPFFRVLCVKCA